MGKKALTPSTRSSPVQTPILRITTNLIWKEQEYCRNVGRSVWGSKMTMMRSKTFFRQKPVFHSKSNELLILIGSLPQQKRLR